MHGLRCGYREVLVNVLLVKIEPMSTAELGESGCASVLPVGGPVS